MEMSNDYVIEASTLEEHKEVYGWTKTELGWSIGFGDYNAWVKSFGPNACTVIKTKDGKLLGGIVTGCYLDNQEAFVGAYYIRPDYRGKGIGTILWNHALARFPDFNIGLYGVLDMSPKYRDRSGFGVISDWVLHYYKLSNITLETFPSVGEHSIIDGKDSDLKALLQYDELVTKGVKREKWLKEYVLNHPDGFSKVALDSGQKVVGFGAIHELYDRIFAFGPLYADNANVAQLLIKSLLEASGPDWSRRENRIFCRSDDNRMVEIIKALEPQILSKTERIPHFTKEIPDFDRERMFIVANYAVNFI